MHYLELLTVMAPKTIKWRVKTVSPPHFTASRLIGKSIFTFYCIAIHKSYIKSLFIYFIIKTNYKNFIICNIILFVMQIISIIIWRGLWQDETTDKCLWNTSIKCTGSEYKISQCSWDIVRTNVPLHASYSTRLYQPWYLHII